MKKKFNIDFVGAIKRWLMISGGIILFGFIFNLIFGTLVDISFTGGALIKYSYVGDVDPDEAAQVLSTAVGKSVETQFNYNVVVAGSDETVNNLNASVSDTAGLSPDQQKKMLDTLEEKYPNNSFSQLSSNSVSPTMGAEFLLKSLVAVLIASAFIVLYVGLRFRKIGGLSAGMFALFALLHDIAIVYFTFVVFRLPLNDNFIAVVLSILGYSLNDTIVIYDRVRENRRLLGAKTSLDVLVNTSINQSFRRTLMTSISTFIAITTVTVLALIYNIQSILSFSLPMMVGLIAGFYSSVCIAGPLWVIWVDKFSGKKKKLSRKKK